jgi:hypothetical protein
MQPERSRPNWAWILGGAGAFLLAGALVAYLSTYGLRLPWQGEHAEPQGMAGSAAEAPADAMPRADAAAAGPAASTPPVDSAAQAAAPRPAPDAALQAGQVSLQLKFATDSWTEIYDGTGKAVLYDLGRAGTERTVTAQAPVSVTLGNGAAVRVAVNGRAATIPSPPAGQTVARFSIGPDGAIR